MSDQAAAGFYLRGGPLLWHTAAMRRRVLWGALAVGMVLEGSWAASFRRADRLWAAALGGLLAAALVWAVPRLDRVGLRPGGVPLLVGAAAVAVYGCVPETGQMLPLAVVLVALGGSEVSRGRPFGAPVHTAAALAVLWAGLFGATGRPSALVGALFAMWPVLLPGVLAGRLAGGPHASGRWWTWGAGWRAVVVIAGTALAAVAVARTGALAPSLAPAVHAVAVAAPLSTVGALGVAWWPRRAAPGRMVT